ncbi:hypothetical protein XH93_05200 [Bradyrhizobium sp. CCBAU 51753]|nr:hypothetical protein XH93_05200 [Bradyrhizobium sp. CCBAU 51753]
MDAIPSIIRVLKLLTQPPQRDLFILFIDQAEELLTLPSEPGISNTREAFFELLEQICFRRMDLRVIVALRTEYYGRLCSYLTIRPTNKLTPPADAWAGLMDYLLRVLREEEIAAAIRTPTSAIADRAQGSPPHSIYGFAYEDALPEMIARDLALHSGEASSLPAMQIVCKQLYERIVLREKRSTILVDDYIRFGRADGALDAYLVRSLREAATTVGLVPLTDRDVDIWAMVLSHVVGRTDGGTVQTLIADEKDLVSAATRRGIKETDALAMFHQMVQSSRRLLRLVGGEHGSVAFSLGHDSLGPSLLRRSTEARVRSEAEAQIIQERQERTLADAKSQALLAKEREERVVAETQAQLRLNKERERASQAIREERHKRHIALAVCSIFALVLLASCLLFVSTVISPLRERTKIITSYARLEQTSDFRLRLILLASAIRNGSEWPNSWFVDVEPTKEALRKVLLRSPAFGGTFEAASWNSDGTKFVSLRRGKLVVRDLTRNEDSSPSELAATAQGNVPPSIGLISSDDSGDQLVAAHVDTGTLSIGRVGSKLVSPDYQLPPPPKDVFVPRAEILGGRIRFILMHFAQNAISGVDVVQLPAEGGMTWKNTEAEPLEWRPREQQAFRQPALAEDCNLYAFVGRLADGYSLYFGQFGSALDAPFKFDHVPAVSAVTIARHCKAVVARDESTVHVISADRAKNTSRSLAALGEAAVITVPSAQQVQPMFAATPKGKQSTDWRLGWSSPGGLSVVDLDGDENPKLLASSPLLTGLDQNYVLGSLSFSPDGTRALMMQQATFNALVQVRQFDLDLDARQAALSKITAPLNLIHEACRVAKLQDGTNQMRSAERITWFGDPNAPQPCDGAN